VDTGWLGGVQYASNYSVAVGRFVGLSDTSRSAFFTVRPADSGACTSMMRSFRPSTREINGYQVLVASPRTVAYGSFACAGNAHGLFIVIITPGRGMADATGLFARHIRLLGPDPADWTTKPIG
jgi:hypothetical protein